MAKTLYSRKNIKEDNVMPDWLEWILYEVYRFIRI